MAISDCTTNLVRYIFVGLMMSQGESKQVSILQKQVNCLYNKYSSYNFLKIINPLFSQVTQWEVFCRDLYYSQKRR